MTYVLKEEQLTGVRDVDDQHKHFYALLERSIEIMDLPYAQALREAHVLLDELAAYAEEHFEHEKAYMRLTNYEAIIPHVAEHEKFVEEVKRAIERRDKLNLADLGNIFVFMSKWLDEHILGLDMKLGRAMPKIALTGEFRTGVDFIDRDHSIMLDTAARIVSSLNAGDTAAAAEAADDMREHAARHIAEEERFMVSAGCPDIESHKEMHRAMMAMMNESELPTVEMVRCVTSALTTHIRKVDRKLTARA